MNIDISGIEDVLSRLKKKDPALFKSVQKKINQLAQLDYEAVMHFKNLRGDLSSYKRVHVGHFVLFFKAEKDVIIFDRLKHHDDAYER
jgi:mRNA-degrading endonuclease RelE of RelBE toxin-antitoxin system